MPRESTIIGESFNLRVVMMSVALRARNCSAPAAQIGSLEWEWARIDQTLYSLQQLRTKHVRGMTISRGLEVKVKRYGI